MDTKPPGPLFVGQVSPTNNTSHPVLVDDVVLYEFGKPGFPPPEFAGMPTAIGDSLNYFGFGGRVTSDDEDES